MINSKYTTRQGESIDTSPGKYQSLFSPATLTFELYIKLGIFHDLLPSIAQLLLQLNINYMPSYLSYISSVSNPELYSVFLQHSSRADPRFSYSAHCIETVSPLTLYFKMILSLLLANSLFFL